MYVSVSTSVRPSAVSSPHHSLPFSLRNPLNTVSIFSPWPPPSLDFPFPRVYHPPSPGPCRPLSPDLPASSFSYPLSPFLLLPPGCASLSHILHSATCSILPSFKPHHPGHKNCHMEKKWTKSSSHSGNICLRLQFKAFCVYCNRL